MTPLRAVLAALLLTVGAGTACVPAPPEEMAHASDGPDAVAVARESVLRIRASSPCGAGVGSGFVIEGNRLVTNRHVIEGARTIELETWDGRTLAAGRARVGRTTDLGVIDLPPATARAVEPLALATEALTPGARLTAIGYANAGPARTTHGQFYDQAPGGRFGESGPVLRMGTSVQPGNSGGPLLDGETRVVGVVFAYEIATLHSLAVPRQRLEAVLADPGMLQPVTPCG